jgi:Secretion system C-terminal sorting domain
MFKQLTSKVTFLLLMVGVVSQAFTVQAAPSFSNAKESVNAHQTNKHIKYSASLEDAEDLVVDEVIMLLSNTSCSIASSSKKYAGETTDISVGNTSPWRAKFQVGSYSADIAMSYDAQTDLLSFEKSFGGSVTYTVDPNGEFIRFYIGGSPFFSFENMKTCGGEMCATLNFSMNNTVMSLYNCGSNGGSTALIARNGTQMQQANAQERLGESTDIVAKTAKKVLVSTHQASPNPFTNTATIQYNLTADALVRLTIYNSLGQQVHVLTNQFQTKGVNTVEWSTTLDAGLYFYEIRANNERMVGKLVKQ